MLHSVIILHAVLLALLMPMSGARADETFRHDLCELAFEYPSGWDVITVSVNQAFSGARQHQCEFHLSPADYEQSASVLNLSEHTLRIRTGYKSFLQAAEDAGFSFDRGAWSAAGSEVTSVRLNNLYGIRGRQQQRCNTKVPGHDIECERSRYVLSSPYQETGRFVTLYVPAAATAPLDMIFKSLHIR